MNKKLGILVHTFPLYSTTFISNEIKVMRELGVHLEIFSIRSPELKEFPNSLLSLKEEIHYLLPINQFVLVKLFLKTLLAKPIPLVGMILVFLGTQSKKALRDKIRGFIHLAEGLALYPKLKAQSIDHLHVHFLLGTSSIALSLNQIYGLPYTVMAHGTDIYVEKILQRQKMEKASFTRVTTEFSKRYLSQLQTKKNLRIEVIPIGIDVHQFKQKTNYEISSKIRILHVGRLVWQKAQHLLLESLSELKTKGIDFQCTIIGEGEERGKLETLITKLNLVSEVQLVGAKNENDTMEYYQQADIFVLCSVSEGWSLVLLEAMASGLPVIGPYLNGIPEMIQHSKNGLLFEKGSSRDLFHKICMYCQDRSLRENLGRHGRLTVLEKYHNKILVQKMLNQIEELP